MADLSVTVYAINERDADRIALEKAQNLGWTDCEVQAFKMVSERYFKTKGGYRWTLGINGTPPPSTGTGRIVDVQRPGRGGWSF